MAEYRNPKPTVDLVIFKDPHFHVPYTQMEIVLIKRKNPPFGWALPGGYVNEGESLEQAALREGKEETDLDLYLSTQFYTYSDPKRDPRQHNLSTVYLAFMADSSQQPRALDDADGVKFVTLADAMSTSLVFDHNRILSDVLVYMLSNGLKRPSTYTGPSVQPQVP